MTVLAAIPSPTQGVWQLGPLPLRAYALCIIAGIVAAAWSTERRWVARGGAPGDGARHRRVGGAVRHHRRPDLPRDHQPAALLRRGRRPAAAPSPSGRAASASGARSPSAGSAPGSPAAGAASRCRPSPTPGPRAARRPGRSAGSATGSTTSCTAADRPAVGPGDPPGGHGGRAVLGRRRAAGAAGHLPPDVPLRAAVEPRRRPLSCLGRPAVPARPRPGVRALRAGYCAGRLWIELLRTDAANEFFGVRLNVFTSIIVGLLRWPTCRQRGRPREVIHRGGRRAGGPRSKRRCRAPAVTDRPDRPVRMITAGGTRLTRPRRPVRPITA